MQIGRSSGDQGVELVEEYYARYGRAGASENLADCPFRFADILDRLLVVCFAWGRLSFRKCRQI